MTLEQFRLLRGDEGQELLRRLAGESLADSDVLPVLARYRKQHAPELVSAAVELTQLRRRAQEKFPQAETMYFTRDGLEMASGDVVARYTAKRFSGMPRVLDLCCGIGGETLALAEVTERVIAVDRDPLHLEMARANARARHLEAKIDFVLADAVEFMQRGLPLLGPVPAIFIDPSRRETRGAARRPEDYSPPLSWCLGLAPRTHRLAIKVSPALDYTALTAEVEIISLRGECKEAILWLGDDAVTRHQATLLPERMALNDNGPTSDALGPIGAWLYEPDPAIIRAHLVQRLAGELTLRRIDPDIAYLTGDTPLTTRFAKAYRVREVLPWNLKHLNAWLKEQGIGRVTIKKRGFPLTPEELRPKLKLAGPHHATLVCTRAMGKAVVVVCGDTGTK